MPAVTVSDVVKKAIDSYAKEQELGTGEAADKLVTLAVNRLNALRRYAKKMAGEAPVPPVERKAKKEKAAKKATAKGPIRRKLGSAKKDAPAQAVAASA
jgi:hypothetical protein